MVMASLPVHPAIVPPGAGTVHLIMSAMTVRSAARDRRRFCSTIRRPVAASIRAGFSLAGRASCRPTPIRGITLFTPRAGNPGQSWKPPAGRTGGGTFSRSPGLRKRRSPSRSCAHRRTVRHRARHQRQAARRAARGAPGTLEALVAALEAYMREQLRRLSPKNKVAKPIRYMLSRWASFTRFLDDGRVGLSNNAAERARAVRRGRAAQLDLRGIRRGRTPGGCDLLPRSNLPPQRRRSARPARRCPRPTPRAKRVSELTPLGMEGKP